MKRNHLLLALRLVGGIHALAYMIDFLVRRNLPGMFIFLAISVGWFYAFFKEFTKSDN